VNYEKLSPALQLTLLDFERGGRAALRRRSGALGITRAEPVSRTPRLIVFLEGEDGASLDHLVEGEVEINRGGSRFRTAMVPLESLERLSEDPAVRRISPARRLRLHMDVASGRVGVVDFRTSSGLTGRGVLVGIVDTGIESVHPAFAGRILRVWDQTLPGPGVPEGPYGVELTGDMQKVSEDTVGHGTHVAGVAAGADPNFLGVAPEADLVIVKTDLFDAHVADGLRYLFRVADELKRPMAANLSIGGHGDSHDGTDPLCSIIDELSGPGRLVMCSAGNEGNDNIHARVDVRQGQNHTIPFSLVADATATFTGWYSGSDEMGVAVVSPSGQQSPFQPVTTEGSPARTYELAGGTVHVATPGPDPANGDHNFLVEVTPSPNFPGFALGADSGGWRLRLRGARVAGAGRVDVWSVDGTVAHFSGPAVHDSTKIGSPGASSQAVTVASYTTKVEWINLVGHMHDAGLDLDEISDFSSEGPRRDDFEKPDVAAPGPWSPPRGRSRRRY
jgi:subtilisin family serine protease